MTWLQEKVKWKVMKGYLLLSKFGQHSGCIAINKNCLLFPSTRVNSHSIGGHVVNVCMCCCAMMAIVDSSSFLCFPLLSFVLDF